MSKILPLSYFVQPHGVCGSQLFPPTDVCSSPETNGISNKKCSPTLAAKVGSEILCLDGFKPSFVLFVGLQASLSLFMGSREDSGHRRGVLSQQRFPAPVFCVGHEGRITPSPSACLLSPAAELHTLTPGAGEAPETENLRQGKAGRLTLFMPRAAPFFFFFY